MHFALTYDRLRTSANIYFDNFLPHNGDEHFFRVGGTTSFSSSDLQLWAQAKQLPQLKNESKSHGCSFYCCRRWILCRLKELHYMNNQQPPQMLAAPPELNVRQKNDYGNCNQGLACTQDL